MEAGGEAALEGLAARAGCGLFLLGAHSKKRPHALTIGRTYDGRLLDAVEVTLEDVKTISGFGSAAARVAAGHKPLVFFAGAPFDADPAMAAAKSLLLDLFRGRVVPAVNLVVREGGRGRVEGSRRRPRHAFPHLPLLPSPPQGVDRIIVILAPGGRRLVVRQYSLALKKSGTRAPRVEAAEVGPAWSATVSRHRPAPPDLEKAALQRVAGAEKKKVRRGGWRAKRRAHPFFLLLFPPRRAAAAPRGDDTRIQLLSDTSCLRLRDFFSRCR